MNTPTSMPNANTFTVRRLFCSAVRQEPLRHHSALRHCAFHHHEAHQASRHEPSRHHDALRHCALPHAVFHRDALFHCASRHVVAHHDVRHAPSRQYLACHHELGKRMSSSSMRSTMSSGVVCDAAGTGPAPVLALFATAAGDLAGSRSEMS
jgi:hypothetical protein